MVEVSSCLTDAGQVFGAILNPALLKLSNPLLAAKPEEVLRLLVTWSGWNNVYHRLGNAPPGSEDVMVYCGTPAQGLPVSGVNDLSTWRKFWESSETGSIQAAIRYQGGDLTGRFTSGAEKLTSEDFRLRPDSAGYRAGPDGKDLGVDVDLVGPGPAYERWKRTPGYQRWLKETGQLRAAVHRPDPGAFVVIGGKGVADRRFATLSDAANVVNSRRHHRGS